jgi:DNA-binding beta-propeller fold protein YncE
VTNQLLWFRSPFTYLTAVMFGLVLLSTPNVQAAAFAYITNQDDRTVSGIDTATNGIVGSPITVGTHSLAVEVTPDGTKIDVTNGKANTSLQTTGANSNNMTQGMTTPYSRGTPAGTTNY